jgi:hypothetical protein
MILSEFAGAAQSLNGSIVVNPWDSQQVADALFEAVTMDEDVRKENHRKLFKVFSSNLFLGRHNAETITVRPEILSSILGNIIRRRTLSDKTYFQRNWLGGSSSAGVRTRNGWEADGTWICIDKCDSLFAS